MKLAMTPGHLCDLMRDATDPNVSPAMQVQNMFDYFLTLDESYVDYEACACATIRSLAYFVHERKGRIIFQDKE